jgi:hypothetical protein
MISRWRQGGVGSGRLFEIFDEYHRIKKKHQVASTISLSLINWFTRFKYILKTRYLKMAY